MSMGMAWLAQEQDCGGRISKHTIPVTPCYDSTLLHGRNIEQLKRIIKFTCPALVNSHVFSLFLFSTHRQNTNRKIPVFLGEL
jgi:hypothetical protein